MPRAEACRVWGVLRSKLPGGDSGAELNGGMCQAGGARPIAPGLL